MDKPTVRLIGEDGNAFAIMAKVIKALRDNNLSDKIDRYKKRALSGDYDNLLQVTSEYVDIV